MFPIPARRFWSRRNALTGARRPNMSEPRRAALNEAPSGSGPSRASRYGRRCPGSSSSHVPKRRTSRYATSAAGVERHRRAPVRVLGQLARGAVAERAGHAKVNDERPSALQTPEEVLPAPVDARHGLAHELSATSPGSIGRVSRGSPISTRSIVAPSSTGASRRRTVSTSGSSGMRAIVGAAPEPATTPPAAQPPPGAPRVP